ncbi:MULTISPECIES: hypothetical protein [Micrococcaceae]|uniref:hypothetical protein n=1 Tax=Micrococcaceae TaxID=1268 RepID=UPI0011136C8C|nr:MULTISPECIES: hypothetical protein [Micrococcaceae]
MDHAGEAGAMRYGTVSGLILPVRRVLGPLALLAGLCAVMAGVLAMHVADAAPRGPAVAPLTVSAPVTGSAPAADSAGTDIAGLPDAAHAEERMSGCTGPFGGTHLATACVLLAVGAVILLLAAPKNIASAIGRALRNPPAGPLLVSALPRLPSLTGLCVSRT